jgi:hypothetical protein
VLVETPLAASLLRPAEPRLYRRVALVLFANVASHPAVWFIFPELGLPCIPVLVLAEAWAVLSEALFYRLVLEKMDAVETLGISALDRPRLRDPIRTTVAVTPQSSSGSTVRRRGIPYSRACSWTCAALVSAMSRK